MNDENSVPMETKRSVSIESECEPEPCVRLSVRRRARLLSDRFEPGAS